MSYETANGVELGGLGGGAAEGESLTTCGVDPDGGKFSPESRINCTNKMPFCCCHSLAFDCLTICSGGTCRERLAATVLDHGENAINTDSL